MRGLLRPVGEYPVDDEHRVSDVLHREELEDGRHRVLQWKQKEEPMHMLVDRTPGLLLMIQHLIGNLWNLGLRVMQGRGIGGVVSLRFPNYHYESFPYAVG